ncbi:MAG: sigma-54 dependent transcriptional regulator [Candidatus Marinimicrobia bacterium]|nr:sigma-54 dependent transcriptional regulator [Candidatus Neomarinimicrobiota bacterium]
MELDRISRLQQSFGILGESDQIREIVETIDQVAGTNITVLLSGESGTGKEIIANAIHKHSTRKHQPFIKVNCGAIPPGILESELFGHIKGSFTGAIEDRKGYFEAANNGTIFLDEIGEMPLETQVRLLRVLELGEFLPVGGSDARHVDVRVIAATNKDLTVEVDKEKFRKDLYYRIKTITIVMPPLRKRAEDIPKMIDKFALDFANRNNIIFKGFSPTAMNVLKEYGWPGNTRELKNFIESMIVLQKGEVITSAMVEKRLFGERPEAPFTPNLPMKIGKSVDQAERELILQQLFMMRREIHEIHDVTVGAMPPMNYQSPAVQLPGNISTLPPMKRQEKVAEEGEVVLDDDTIIHPDKIGHISMEEVERDLIERTLKKFNYKKRQTANALKISERTLYRKIIEYKLKDGNV